MLLNVLVCSVTVRVCVRFYRSNPLASLQRVFVVPRSRRSGGCSLRRLRRSCGCGGGDKQSVFGSGGYGWLVTVRGTITEAHRYLSTGRRYGTTGLPMGFLTHTYLFASRPCPSCGELGLASIPVVSTAGGSAPSTPTAPLRVTARIRNKTEIWAKINAFIDTGWLWGRPGI